MLASRLHVMRRLLRHTVAAAAVRAVTCVSSALAASSGIEAAETTAHVLEVGHGGQIVVGEPATVRVEVSTQARLSATFRAWLARPREGHPRDEMLGTPSAAAGFLLEAGETRVLNAYLPDVGDDACHGGQLRWTVESVDGRRLAEGAEPVVCLPNSRHRVLYLTEEPLPSRRTPAAAYDEVQSYLGYTVCVVSGLDFAQLREEQRQALLDWAALGATLVITAPLAPAGQSIDRLLKETPTLLWSDTQGHELREARNHLGFLRTIDLPLSSVAATPPASPLFRLLTSGSLEWPGGPGSPLFGRGEDPRPYEGVGRIGRPLGAAAIVLALVVGASLAWSSHPRVAVSSAAIAGFSALLAVAPAFIYMALRALPAGNGDRCWDVVLHDPVGGRQSRWTTASLGGGGGRTDPVLSFTVHPNVAWRAERSAEVDSSVQTELDTDGRLRVGVERRSLSFDRLIVVRRVESEINDSVWDADVVARGNRVTGSLRALRAFARVGLIGRTGVAWLGSVRQGERIDLSRVTWLGNRYFPGGTDPLELVALDLLLATYGVSGPSNVRSALYAVATEGAPCSATVSAGGEPCPPCTVHVQPVLNPDDWAGWLPAQRSAELLRVQVPAALWARMSTEVRVLRPYVSYIDESPPAVSPDVVDGFREVVFRVGGAPSDTLPGDGGVVLGRWQPRDETVRKLP